MGAAEYGKIQAAYIDIVRISYPDIFILNSQEYHYRILVAVSCMGAGNSKSGERTRWVRAPSRSG